MVAYPSLAHGTPACRLRTAELPQERGAPGPWPACPRPGACRIGDHRKVARPVADRVHDASPRRSRQLGRRCRNPVPRPAEAGAAGLRTGAAPGPRGVRDLRRPLAPARQRHPGVPCAQRRRPRGRLREGAAGREHARRVRGRGSRRHGRQGARLVGRDDRPWQGFRHRPLLCCLCEPAWRVPRDDWAVVGQPGDRKAVRAGLPRDHCRGHGAGPSARSWTHSASSGSPR